MATPFQPMLQGGGTTMPQGRLIQKDYSGLLGALNNFSRPQAASGGGDSTKEQDNLDKSILQDEILGLHEERIEGQLAEQQLQDEIMAYTATDQTSREDIIQEDGTVLSFEQQIGQQVQKLQQMQRQGLGNPLVFAARRNQLMRQALRHNPNLADSVRTLYGSELAKPDGSAGAGFTSDATNDQMRQKLHSMYGNAWGAEEYAMQLKNEAVVANYEMNKTLGTITAAESYSQIDRIMGTQLQPWTARLHTALAGGGVLSPEQEDQLNMDLTALQQRAYQDINENFTRLSQRTGQVVSIQDKKAHFDRVDELIRIQRDLMKDKDVITKSRQFQEMYKFAHWHNAPNIVKNAYSIGGGEGGVGNLMQLAHVLSNENTLHAAIASGQEWLKHVDSGQRNEMISQVFASMINDVPLSEEMQRLGNRLGVVVMGSAPAGQDIAPGLRRGAIQSLEDEVGGPNPDISDFNLPNNIRSAVDVATSPNYVNNLLETGSAADHKQFSAVTHNFAATALRLATERLEAGTGSAIEYNPQTRRFETANATTYRNITESVVGEGGGPLSGLRMMAMPTPGLPITLDVRENARAVSVLNDVLRLSDTAKLSGLVPKHDDIIKNFYALEETIQQEKQQEAQRRATNQQRLKEAREHLAQLRREMGIKTGGQLVAPGVKLPEGERERAAKAREDYLEALEGYQDLFDEML